MQKTAYEMRISDWSSDVCSSDLSIVQGLVITAGVLFAYQWAVQNGGSEEKTRAMVFTTLIFANILLSLTNRSFHYSLFESFKNKNMLFAVVRDRKSVV